MTAAREGQKLSGGITVRVGWVTTHHKTNDLTKLMGYISFHPSYKLYLP